MMKKYSLRTHILAIMALVLLLQSLSWVVALSASHVFEMLDAEAVRLVNNATTNRAQSLNTAVGHVIGGVAQEAIALGRALDDIALGAGSSPELLYQDDMVYPQAASASAQAVANILKNHAVSGAFVVFNGSNVRKDSTSAHSAVYIRNTGPPRATDSTVGFQLELGSIALTRQLGIVTSTRWNLDLVLPDLDAPSCAFYSKPIAAAALAPFAEIERHGYWSVNADFFGDGKEDIVFSLPMVDANGNTYGVVGFAISRALFIQSYLPNVPLPYSSFMAVIPAAGQPQEQDWLISNSSVAQVHLEQVDNLDLRPAENLDLWQTELPGLGEMYCSVQELEMYSRNSPFYQESWSLVSFVQREVLHETSAGVRSSLNFHILLTTVFSFAAVFVLGFFVTRRISGLSSYVRSLTGINTALHFNQTGIREIDDLTKAVEALNRNAISASTATSKILELTLLPIGGYEVSRELNHAVLTEYIYRLLAIPVGTYISQEEWDHYHGLLVANPAAGYDDIYKYEDPKSGMRWLRILEAATPSGKVGVVLDVTKDISEHKRLAHELDYDALTRLLNRTAFKREAYQLLSARQDKVGAVIFADLDNLKHINDTFGHDVGDRLIIHASEMFRSFERLGGIVARISGDEFAICLHGFDTKEQAREKIFEQFRQAEANTLLTPNGDTQKIRYSAGVAFYPLDSEDISDLLKLADFAMYEAKNNQKGSVFEFCKQSYENQTTPGDGGNAVRP